MLISQARDANLPANAMGQGAHEATPADPLAALRLPDDESAVLCMRAQLLAGVRDTVRRQGWSKAEAMRRLRLSRTRLANLLGGDWNRFDLDLLVALAARVGMKPSLRLDTD